MADGVGSLFLDSPENYGPCLRIENIFRAIANVSPSQLADRELFDFINLGSDASVAAEAPDWLMPGREAPRPLQIN